MPNRETSRDLIQLLLLNLSIKRLSIIQKSHYGGKENQGRDRESCAKTLRLYGILDF